EGGDANVTMRGVTPMGIELRPQVKHVNGRWFTPGKREAVASVKIAKRFASCDLEQRFKAGGAELTVVGWFGGGATAIDAGVWVGVPGAMVVRGVWSAVRYVELQHV